MTCSVAKGSDTIVLFRRVPKLLLFSHTPLYPSSPTLLIRLKGAQCGVRGRDGPSHPHTPSRQTTRVGHLVTGDPRGTGPLTQGRHRTQVLSPRTPRLPLDDGHSGSDTMGRENEQWNDFCVVSLGRRQVAGLRVTPLRFRLNVRASC